MVKQVVKCGLPWSEDFLGVLPTGIPPHVTLLAQMQELRETYGWVSDGLVHQIIADLDDRQMGGVMSEARICELFHAELDAV